MLLAELEIRHTRANLPTRRVALGLRWLPVDPAPGFGGVLDVIDSPLLAAPFAYLVFSLL